MQFLLSIWNDLQLQKFEFPLHYSGICLQEWPTCLNIWNMLFFTNHGHCSSLLTQDDDICHYRPEFSAVNETGFVDIPSGKEHALMMAVASVGPIAVAIDASHESFQFYQSGE